MAFRRIFNTPLLVVLMMLVLLVALVSAHSTSNTEGILQLQAEETKADEMGLVAAAGEHQQTLENFRRNQPLRRQLQDPGDGGGTGAKETPAPTPPPPKDTPAPTAKTPKDTPAPTSKPPKDTPKDTPAPTASPPKDTPKDTPAPTATPPKDTPAPTATPPKDTPPPTPSPPKDTPAPTVPPPKETPAPTPTPSPTKTKAIENEDPCKAASTCEDCQIKAAEVFDASSEDTCAYVMGGDELIACQTVKKSSIADREGDQCSKTTSGGGDNNAKPTAPPAGDTNSLVFPDDDEESHMGPIFGLLFLLACGGMAFKNKDKIMSQLNAPGGMGGGPGAKAAKYHEVSVDEEDDGEWGWGDDDGGDVELASSSRDDNSVHKRRSASHDSLPPVSAPTHHSVKSSPLSSYKKSSPRVTSQVKSHITADHQHYIPKLPTSTGMSLSKPKAGVSPVAPSPATAPAVNMPGFSSQMQGLKITSLGPKRSVAAAPAKKAAAPAPSPEDDIFASMGLATKPKFSHAPAAAAAPKPAPAATLTSSRWGAPAPAAASTLISSGNSFDAGDDDDNWDDDGDLDDLLDD